MPGHLLAESIGTEKLLALFKAHILGGCAFTIQISSVQSMLRRIFVWHVRVRKDVVIAAVVRGKIRRVKNPANVKTVEFFDNCIALKL